MVKWNMITKIEQLCCPYNFITFKKITTSNYLSKVRAFSDVVSDKVDTSSSKFNDLTVSLQNIKIVGDKIKSQKYSLLKYNVPFILKIPFTDLRLIDSVDNNHNPSILVRKNAILLNTGFISCVIRFNEIWFFNPSSKLVSKGISLIKENLQKKWNLNNANGNVEIQKEEKGNKLEYQQKHFYVEENDKGMNKDLDESFLKQDSFYRYNTNSTFEFMCLDICMQLSLKEYEEDIDIINEKICRKMELQRKDEESNEMNILTNKILIDMMMIKNNLQKLSNLLNTVRSSIAKILKDENDMERMCLSFLHKNQKNDNTFIEHGELEILLEVHLQLTDELYSRLKSIEEKITHYEELMRLNLDYNRNKLILLNVKISFITLFCSLASVVTGLFGMNLKNFMELNEYAFPCVCSCVLFCSFMGLYYTRNISKILELFQRKRRN